MDFNIVQSYILKLPEIESLKRIDKIKEIIEYYSEEIVEEYLKAIIDKRHKVIVAAKDEQELSQMDFSYDYYIETLRKKLIEEKGRPIKKVINATGIIYSKYLGERFYSDEILKKFENVFKNYNNLEFDEENSEKINIDSEFEKLLEKSLQNKKVLLVENVLSGIFLVCDTFFKNRNVLMALSDTYYFSDGFGMQDIIEKSGCKKKICGYINKVDFADYEKEIESENDCVIFSDMIENSEIGIKKIDLEDFEKLTEKVFSFYISDRVYINTESEEIKKCGIDLEKILSKNIDIVLIDLSKFIGGPESALIIAKDEIIDKIKGNFMSTILKPNKETRVLMYLVLKAYLDRRYNDIYINKCFLLTNEKLKEKNRRFMRNLEREIGDKIEMWSYPAKLLKLNETTSELYSFERDVIRIKPLYKNAFNIEKELRQNDPNILCWLDNDSLIFNLQLVKEDDENIIIDILSKKI